MCGIAGLLGLAGAPPVARERLEAMIHALKHRGPDGFGFHMRPNVGLAHARLSIIDLSTGDQPIANEDRTIWVVFNGEVFNYIELRRDLVAAGHAFRTESDTEVIVHLYEQYGEGFVDHLNGQFAIALWDERAQRLVLARDRAGIRPLFYVSGPRELAFASEIKSLVAGGCFEPRLDPRAIAQIFTYWAPLPGCTPFVGVQALAPGHVLVAERGRTRVRRYWDWSFAERPRRVAAGIEATTAAARELLLDAVRLQLRSDVPVGAYLSGGLDSSIIAALVREATGDRLRTFSVAFEDAEFDETEYQDRMVRFLGTEHSRLVCTTRDIGNAFPRAVWHAETPILRTAPVPLMLLSGMVRELGYKVVLTGEGADEVFAGYDLYKEAKIRRWIARTPGSRWRPRLLERLYPYLKNSPARGRAFTAKFFTQGAEHIGRGYFSHLPRWETTQRTWQFFAPAVRDSLAHWDPLAAIEATFPPDLMQWPPLGRDQYVEAETLLAGYLLSSQGDRMGMANSVEGRFPFLDHRLIEFAARVPSHWHVRGLTEKYLLRRAARGIVPQEILRRTKQPYRAPDSQSFFPDGCPLDYVEALLSPAAVRDAGYFDPVAVGKLFEKCRSGRAIGFADNMSFVGVLSTMVVHDCFVARRRALHVA